MLDVILIKHVCCQLVSSPAPYFSFALHKAKNTALHEDEASCLHDHATDTWVGLIYTMYHISQYCYTDFTQPPYICSSELMCRDLTSM